MCEILICAAIKMRFWSFFIFSVVIIINGFNSDANSKAFRIEILVKCGKLNDLLNISDVQMLKFEF